MIRRLLILTILLAIGLAHAKQITIKRVRSYLREGPGSFYEVITELPVGESYEIQETVGRWVKIASNDQVGFVSERAGTEAKGRNAINDLGSDVPSIQVSRHGMSAGAKGFSGRVSKLHGGSVKGVQAILDYKINLTKYGNFALRGKNDYHIVSQRKPSIPPSDAPEFFSFKEEIVGFTLAASVMEKYGVVENDIWMNYINCLGNYVASNSEGYDREFRFFILDIPEANAYAFPGGVILITKGLLQLLDNEAELAVVLGHEIAHVNRFHGLMEMEKRKHHINAENAFSELDEEVPDAYDEHAKEIEAELEEDLLSIYETLVEGRLDQYEQEADQLAMIYAARSGYDPIALGLVLQRLQGASCNNEHMRSEIVGKRVEWFNASKDKFSRIRGVQMNRERFMEKKLQAGW